MAGRKTLSQGTRLLDVRRVVIGEMDRELLQGLCTPLGMKAGPLPHGVRQRTQDYERVLPQAAELLQHGSEVRVTVAKLLRQTLRVGNPQVGRSWWATFVNPSTYRRSVSRR